MGLKEEAEGLLPCHLPVYIPGVAREEAGFGVVDQGVPEPDPTPFRPVVEPVGERLGLARVPVGGEDPGFHPGAVLGVDLGEEETGIVEKSLRRIPHDLRRPGGDVVGRHEEEGLWVLEPWGYYGLVNHTRKGF